MTERQRLDEELARLGKAIYGEKWPQVLALNVRRMTEDGHLDDQQVRALIKGLRILKAHRP